MEQNTNTFRGDKFPSTSGTFENEMRIFWYTHQVFLNPLIDKMGFFLFNKLV